MHEGEVIRKALLERGIKHSAVYSRLHVSRSTFANWLASEKLPIDKILQIAEITGIPMGEMIPKVKDYAYNVVREEDPEYGEKMATSKVKQVYEDLILLIKHEKKEHIKSLQEQIELQNKMIKMLESQLASN